MFRLLLCCVFYWYLACILGWGEIGVWGIHGVWADIIGVWARLDGGVGVCCEVLRVGAGVYVYMDFPCFGFGCLVLGLWGDFGKLGVL